MIEGIIIGVIAGWLAAAFYYQNSLQEYKKRVKYLQETLSLCNDQDD